MGFVLSLGCGLAINDAHKEVINAKAEDTGTFVKIKATEVSTNLEEGLYLIEATYNYNKASYDAIMKAEYNNDKNEKLAGTVLKKTSGNYVNPDNGYIWKLAKTGDYWTIYNESTKKYAAATSQENKAALVDSIDDDGYAKWTIKQSTRNGKSDCFDIINVKRESKQYLGNGGNSNTGGPFACYTQGATTSITLYKKTLTPSEEAEAWGKSFMETDTALTCEDENVDNSDNLVLMWSDFEDEYNNISDDAKNVVKAAVGDNNGSTYLAKAVARYDHIIARYSSAHTEINDFIGRNSSASGLSKISKGIDNNNYLIVIFTVSFISITAVGGYFFLRKRKVN